MAKSNVVQTNFTSGEISPAMLGRVDNGRYFNGVRELVNMKVKPHGGAYKRPGTKFIVETKDSAASNDYTCIVRNFLFSNDQSYVIEFGHNALRIFKDDVLLSDLMGGGETSLTTPWGHTEVRDLQFTQSADVLYITHPSYQPRTLSRNADNDWVLATFENSDGPYLDYNTDTTKEMVLSNVVDEATLTVTGGGIFDHDTKAAVAISGITQANPGVVTHAASTLVDGEFVAITGVAGMTELNGNVYRVNQLSTTTFELQDHEGNGIDTSGFTAYSGSGSVQPLEGGWIEFRYDGTWLLCKITGYSSDTVVTVDIRGDAIYSTGSSDNTFNTGTSVVNTTPSSAFFAKEDVNKYVRWGPHVSGDSARFLGGKIDASGGLGSFDSTTGGWAKISDVRNTTFSEATVGTPLLLVDWTEGTHTFAITGRTRTATVTSNFNAFASTDVGRWIRLRYGNEVVAAEITAYSSATVVTVQMLNDEVTSVDDVEILYDDGKTYQYALGAWSNTTGWPSCCCFHEQRLVFATTSTQPQTVWMSKSGDFTNFAPSDYELAVTDDSAITYTIASYSINKIVWLQPGPVLLIGTVGSEWQTKASQISEPITPTNIQVTNQANYGSPDQLAALRIGQSVIHVEITGRKIRELTYSFESDAFRSANLNIIAEHILRDHNSVLDIAYQLGEDSIIWLAMNDGELIGITYERDQEVFAFHRHQLAGDSTTVVESVATLPPTTNTPGELYMVVKRTIDGSTVRYIEKLTADFDPANSTDTDSMVFLDSHITNTNFTGTSLTGLSHLEGETVTVVADGVSLGTYTVSSGAVTIANQTNAYIHAGYPIQADIRTMPLEYQAPGGFSHGRVSRISEVVFNLKNSMGTLKVGKDTSSFIEKDLGTSALVTEPKSVMLNTGHERAPDFYVRHSDPYSLEILSMSTTLETAQV